MQQFVRRRWLVGVLGVLSWAVTAAWAQTPGSPATTKPRLERLRIAVAPTG